MSFSEKSSQSTWYASTFATNGGSGDTADANAQEKCVPQFSLSLHCSRWCVGNEAPNSYSPNWNTALWCVTITNVNHDRVGANARAGSLGTGYRNLVLIWGEASYYHLIFDVNKMKKTLPTQWTSCFLWPHDKPEIPWRWECSSRWPLQWIKAGRICHGQIVESDAMSQKMCACVSESEGSCLNSVPLSIHRKRLVVKRFCPGAI